MPTVEFCRINRRTNQPNLVIRPFRDDVQVLATQGRLELRATVRRVEFIAADLAITLDDNFLTGLLGFAEEETLRQFEADTHSWLKGETTEFHGATRQTVVPFAVDLREHRRWTAYVTTGRIRSTFFRQAFEAVLNHAVGAMGLLPVDWEVDLVMSTTALTDWISEHPDVIQIRRTVKLVNPLKDVDEARRKMRALRGDRYRDVISAGRNETLDVANDSFQRHIAPIETGDAVVEITARMGEAGTQRFKSETHSERTVIPPYRQDLQAGIERVLGVLATFSDLRGDVVHEEG